MAPPWRSTQRAAMASPSPVPGCFASRPRPVTKGWNSVASISFGTPGPPSSTRTSTAPAVRAAVTAMREIFAAIRRDGGIHNVDKQIVSVEEIFRLQDMDRVKADEKRFLR